MNDIDCSYDDLLCRFFHRSVKFRWLYDHRIEEDNAFVFLKGRRKKK